MHNSSRNVGLYLTFLEKEVRIILWLSNTKEFLSDWKIPLLEIVPSLVESLEKELLKHNFGFNNLSEIYLTQRTSGWNSNRLLITFVKTLSFALLINVYVLDDRENSSKDVELLENDREGFLKFLQIFKKIYWKELKPLYNSCPITNT